MPTAELKAPWEVLVVDDEAAIRELLLAYFNSVGMRVTGAQDGRGWHEHESGQAEAPDTVGEAKLFELGRAGGLGHIPHV